MIEKLTALTSPKNPQLSIINWYDNNGVAFEHYDFYLCLDTFLERYCAEHKLPMGEDLSSDELFATFPLEVLDNLLPLILLGAEFQKEIHRLYKDIK
jgi:hypothetical protein